METNLILEGFKFMGLGMATVFTFLVILIFMMNLMSRIISRFFPEPKPIDNQTKNTQNKKNTF